MIVSILLGLSLGLTWLSGYAIGRMIRNDDDGTPEPVRGLVPRVLAYARRSA